MKVTPNSENPLFFQSHSIVTHHTAKVLTNLIPRQFGSSTKIDKGRVSILTASRVNQVIINRI